MKSFSCRAAVVAAALFLSCPAEARQGVVEMLGFDCAIGVELSQGVKMLVLAKSDKTYDVSYEMPPEAALESGNPGIGPGKAELFVEKVYPFQQEAWRSKDEDVITNFYENVAKDFFGQRAFVTEAPEYLPSFFIGQDGSMLFIQKAGLINNALKAEPCNSAPASRK